MASAGSIGEKAPGAFEAPACLLRSLGYPDARLGERACAFVVPREGASLAFAEMVAYLNAQQMAQQYIPERLEVVTELPRTPSGKIQKFKLRETAKAFSTQLAG